MFGVQNSWAASKAAKEKDRPPLPRVYVYNRGGEAGGKTAPPQQHVCPNGVSIGVGGASQRSPPVSPSWSGRVGQEGNNDIDNRSYPPSHHHHHHAETNTNTQWDSSTQHQWQDTEPAMSPSFSPTARRAVRFHQHLNHEPGRPAAARRAAPSRPSSAPSNRRAAGGALAPKWETSVALTGRSEGRPATGAFRAGRVKQVKHTAMDSDFASPGASMQVCV